MTTPGTRWLDAEAGPVIRPYALTGGRTKPAGQSFDLITMITAVRGARLDPAILQPEHQLLLRMCRLPTSVADLSAELKLPIGVIQIILADLLERGLVNVYKPVQPARLPDVELLRRVADGLRRL